MIPLQAVLETDFLNWQQIITTAIFSLLSAGAGTAVTFLVFKAKVTEELKAIRSDINDLRGHYSKHVDENNKDFKEMEGVMEEKIANCHDDLIKSENRFLAQMKDLARSNQEDHKTIVGTLTDISKSINAMVKDLGYMSGKLDSHIESSK